MSEYIGLVYRQYEKHPEKFGDLTPKIIEEYLHYPRDFGYWGPNKDMFQTWGFVTGHSYSCGDGTLGLSNFQVISQDVIRRFPKYAEIIQVGGAFGDIDYLGCQVITKKGFPAKAFLAYMEWKKQLDNYPVADEEHYSNLEMEDFNSSFETMLDDLLNYNHNGSYGKFDICEGLPEDWKDSLLNELSMYRSGGFNAETLDYEEIIQMAEDCDFLKNGENNGIYQYPDLLTKDIFEESNIAIEKED